MMKRKNLQLSKKQQEMLMTYAANPTLSIDQIAKFKSYPVSRLSSLVRSRKGQSFLGQIMRFPPSFFNGHTIPFSSLSNQPIPPRSKKSYPISTEEAKEILDMYDSKP